MSKLPRPTLLYGFAAACVAGLLVTYFSETVFRPFLLLVLTVVAFFTAVRLWVALGAERAVRKRRGLWALAGVLVGIVLAAALLRIEGSADGSSIPNVVWRWVPEEGSGVGELAVPGGAEGAVPAPPGAEDSFFLGRARDGVVETTGSFAWEVALPQEVWRREVGLGWSGFAVSGGYAVTQEQRGGDELVTCYRLETGEPLWKHTTAARFSEHFGGDGPRATPVVREGRVYAQGATGSLVCLQLGTGERIWERDVLADTGSAKNLEWGKSNTPLVTSDHVIATGGEDGSTLVAYSSADGSVAWRAGTDRASYSSPALIEIGGEDLIVSVNAQSVTAHEQASGATRWTFEWPGTLPKVGQPVSAGGGRILVTAGYDGADTYLLAVTGKTVEPVWGTRKLKTKFSSAVVYGGHAYGLHQGRLACISLADGSRKWRGAKLGYGQNLLLPGGKLLVQEEKGHVVVVPCEPDEEPETVRFKALSGKTWNVPTVAGRYLLVRNAKEMACYQLP